MVASDIEHMFAHRRAPRQPRPISFPGSNRLRFDGDDEEVGVATGDEPTTTVVVVMAGDDVVVVRVEGGPPDLGVVHHLARLTLHLKRRGTALRVEEPPAELCELLDLCGLSHLLPPGTCPETL
jgi:hypothetical protein